jgi:ATP-binding cassette subfamily C (CFTR/MRP) protein 1
VLVWVPCVFLWTFSSLEVYYILHSKKRDIPWNWVNVSKLLGTAVLFVLTVTDLVTSINSSESDTYNVDIYTPIIKLLSFVSIPVSTLYTLTVMTYLIMTLHITSQLTLIKIDL